MKVLNPEYVYSCLYQAFVNYDEHNQIAKDDAETFWEAAVLNKLVEYDDIIDDMPLDKQIALFQFIEEVNSKHGDEPIVWKTTQPRYEVSDKSRKSVNAPTGQNGASPTEVFMKVLNPKYVNHCLHEVLVRTADSNLSVADKEFFAMSGHDKEAAAAFWAMAMERGLVEYCVKECVLHGDSIIDEMPLDKQVAFFHLIEEEIVKRGGCPIDFVNMNSLPRYIYPERTPVEEAAYRSVDFFLQDYEDYFNEVWLAASHCEGYDDDDEVNETTFVEYNDEIDELTGEQLIRLAALLNDGFPHHVRVIKRQESSRKMEDAFPGHLAMVQNSDIRACLALLWDKRIR